MAANDASATQADEAESQVTFNIKASNDTKYVLTVPTAMTVGDLKQKLSTSEYANLPSERQRLIYSGRVLKDPDTLGSCKIKDGNTVHLVRGAESNSRQAPANQAGAAPVPGAGQPASNVPSNIAAGTGTGNPLAQLTGARYAGFLGLPDMDMFGADGGMGAPPNADQMLRMLEDPNFASQMNEAMNNPAVIDMLRNNPMIRNNPMARQALENPEFRRMIMNPDMIRMQMQMQRAMGGGPAGEGSFPMPGQTDTTDSATPNTTGNTTNNTSTTADASTQNTTTQSQTPANPFAALFPGMGQAGTQTAPGNQMPPLSSFGFGAPPQAGQGENQADPFSNFTQRIMQDPEMMQRMMRALGGGGAGAGAGTGAEGGNPTGGLPPFLFPEGFGAQAQSQEPPDTRPPEERYAEQLRQLNEMGFHEFERNIQALRRSGGNVQGAVEYLLTN